MDKATFEKYLKERYYDQMEYYDRKAGFYQKRYKKFQWILIILSAVTPVLAALEGNKMLGDFSLNIFVIITSAIVAVLTTGLKTFQYQELWVSYRLTQELLKPEIYYYQFNVNGYDAVANKEALFVTRIETILDTEHKSWPVSKKNQSTTEQTEPPTPETNAGNTAAADTDTQ